MIEGVKFGIEPAEQLCHRNICFPVAVIGSRVVSDERNSYVAPYDREDQIVELLAKAYADWDTNKLPHSTVPAIGTRQAVDAILNELKI
jgi:hypothetical protein